jgi:hypothetical protein
MTDLDNIAREWLAARGIIMAFLRELLPAMSESHLEHNAAAILARLASATPPLLLTAMDEWPQDHTEELEQLREAIAPFAAVVHSMPEGAHRVIIELTDEDRAAVLRAVPLE